MLIDIYLFNFCHIYLAFALLFFSLQGYLNSTLAFDFFYVHNSMKGWIISSAACDKRLWQIFLCYAVSLTLLIPFLLIRETWSNSTISYRRASSNLHFLFGCSLCEFLSCWWNCSNIITMRIVLSFFFLFSLPAILAQEVTHPTILVDGTATIATNDNNFICATLDWWPHDKCDYNQCPWHYTSAINLVRLWKTVPLYENTFSFLVIICTILIFWGQ